MTVALARQKGFAVNEEQARKELGFAIATDEPVLEPNRLGSSPIGGGSDTLGYTLMGMAAAGAPADGLTDAHIHFMSLNQYPDGAFRTRATAPDRVWFVTTFAVVLRSIKLYPIPAAARSSRSGWTGPRWLLSASFSTEDNDPCSSMRSRICVRLNPNALRS